MTNLPINTQRGASQDPSENDLTTMGLHYTLPRFVEGMRGTDVAHERFAQRYQALGERLVEVEQRMADADNDITRGYYDVIVRSIQGHLLTLADNAVTQDERPDFAEFGAFVDTTNRMLARMDVPQIDEQGFAARREVYAAIPVTVVEEEFGRTSQPKQELLAVGVGHDGPIFGIVEKNGAGQLVFVDDFFDQNHNLVSQIDLNDIRAWGALEFTFEEGQSAQIEADEAIRTLRALPHPYAPGRSLTGEAWSLSVVATPAASTSTPTVLMVVPVSAYVTDGLGVQDPTFDTLLGVGVGPEGAVIGEAHVPVEGGATVFSNTLVRIADLDLENVARDGLTLPGMPNVWDIEIGPDDAMRALGTLPDLDHIGLGQEWPAADSAAPAVKDRYDRAVAVLTEQEVALATRIEQWNPHNEAMKSQIDRYTTMVSDVHSFVLTALDKADGDRDRVALLFEQTSEKFEPHLVTAGARKPEVPQFAAPIAVPSYEPTSLRPARDTSLDNVDPTF